MVTEKEVRCTAHWKRSIGVHVMLLAAAVLMADADRLLDDRF
jgi:hypothetical protein